MHNKKLIGWQAPKWSKKQWWQCHCCFYLLRAAQLNCLTLFLHPPNVAPAVAILKTTRHRPLHMSPAGTAMPTCSHLCVPTRQRTSSWTDGRTSSETAISSGPPQPPASGATVTVNAVRRPCHASVASATGILTGYNHAPLVPATATWT